MKKEILIAILIGFILGLIITFGIWTANKSLKNTQEEQPSTEGGISVSEPEKKETLALEIIEPKNNSISDEEEITIKGNADPSTVITIIYQEGEEIIEADEEGNFEAEITLVGGANEIQISAFDEEGNEASKILNIIYSTAEI